MSFTSQSVLCQRCGQDVARRRREFLFRSVISRLVPRVKVTPINSQLVSYCQDCKQTEKEAWIPSQHQTCHRCGSTISWIQLIKRIYLGTDQDPLCKECHKDLIFSDIKVKNDNTKEEGKETKDTTEQMLLEFSNNTSLHGMKYVTNGKNKLVRFLYLVIIAVFAMILLKLLINLSMDYFSFPIIKQYTASVQQEMIFPAITMCTFNTYNTSNKTLGILTKAVETGNYSDPLFSMEAEAFYSDVIVEENVNFTSRFYSKVIEQDKWKHTVMVMQGWPYQCHSYNMANGTIPFISYKPGLMNGLQIYLINQGSTNVMRIFLHSPFKEASVRDSSFFVGPGFSTFSVICPERVTLLGYPYHPIEDDCKGTDISSIHNQRECEEECLSNYCISVCKCKSPYTKGRARKCSLREAITCYAEAAEQFDNNKRRHFNMCKCPRSCSYITFMTRNSMAVLHPPDSSVSFGVYIYYENFILRDVSEVEKRSADEIISQFGGQMGFFLGASIITVLETVELIMNILWIKCSRLMSVSSKPDY